MRTITSLFLGLVLAASVQAQTADWQQHADETTAQAAIAGADPCHLCSQNPVKWPGACEMCWGSDLKNEIESAVVGGQCCSELPTDPSCFKGC